MAFSRAKISSAWRRLLLALTSERPVSVLTSAATVASAVFILALFVAIGLMSIYPTRQFLRMRPVLRQGGTPAIDPAHLRRIRRVIHIEATLVVLMILCASLMAHGIGLIGD